MNMPIPTHLKNSTYSTSVDEGASSSNATVGAFVTKNSSTSPLHEDSSFGLRGAMKVGSGSGHKKSLL